MILVVVGHEVHYDEEDHDLVMSRSWSIIKNKKNNRKYVKACNSGTYLPHLLTKFKYSTIRFKDGNGLNCRKANLRLQ